MDAAPVSIPAIDPSTLESSGFEMSNFDGQIPEKMAEALIAGSRGGHPARDHYGDVWYEQELFWERVKQYRVVVGVHSAATLRELFDQVNAQYGDR